MVTAAAERSYYSISQAAAVLGVSRVSMWRWINAGQVPVARLGHRTARIHRDDLDRLVRQRSGASTVSNGHFAQFYDVDEVLLDACAHYLGTALQGGDAAIIIATAEHVSVVEDRIRGAGIDLQAMRAAGRYIALDACATLSEFMVDDVPQADAFERVVGGALDRLAGDGRRVRAFGEMVAVLAGAGNFDGALSLELLWNDLVRTRSFSLFCAYPLATFSGEGHSKTLHDVASAHDHIVPAESYMALAADARSREVLLLQQKARSLEAEIVRRTQAEEQLRQALLAEQAARAAAEAALLQRDEFVSVASHELKTPLTTLSGYAQLVLRRLSRESEFDPERVTHAMQSIMNQADKLSRLLGNLLDISRLEEGKLRLERQSVDVARLVEETVALTRGRSDKHNILVASPPSTHANIDGLRIEQVLTNLLDNAIKYSPQGGPIEVVVARRRGAIELSVRDHGMGIPPERRDHIFERFYQAHSDGYRSGLGLGLYISRQIVELHGGTIHAEFPRSGGTRFVVRVPVAAPRRATAQVSAD